MTRVHYLRVLDSKTKGLKNDLMRWGKARFCMQTEYLRFIYLIQFITESNLSRDLIGLASVVASKQSQFYCSEYSFFHSEWHLKYSILCYYQTKLEPGDSIQWSCCLWTNVHFWQFEALHSRFNFFHLS
jgi:hypothetical protein